MTLKTIFIYYSVIEIDDQKESLTKLGNRPNGYTRNTETLVNLRFRLTTSAKNSVNAKLYNKLPNKMKAFTIHKSKKAVKNLLLKLSIYKYITQNLDSKIETEH